MRLVDSLSFGCVRLMFENVRGVGHASRLFVQMLCWRSFVWRLFTGNLDYGISPVSLITRLEPDGLVALAEALKANTSLTTLDLGGDLGPGDFVALAEALKANTSLTTLTLRGKLGPDGIVALAEALKVNRSLTTLTLGGDLDSGDLLDPNGLVALAEALKVNTSLTTLDVSRCRLDDVKPLAEALELNTSLATLNLPDNVDPVVQAEIDARLARNRAEAESKGAAAY